MDSVFAVQKNIRENLLRVLDSNSLEQLNKIPERFNNNIIWNIAHCAATQQALVYKLSGLPTQLPEEFIMKYRKGAKPEGDLSQQEVDEIRELLLTTSRQIEEDFKNNVFVQYQEYPTSVGFTLRNIEEALNFNNYHEGIHLGIIMSIRKFV